MSFLLAHVKPGDELTAVQLPYSCRSGACSTCFATCTIGKVEVTSNEVLTPEDLKNGYILTCTGHPLTDDVVIEFK